MIKEALKYIVGLGEANVHDVQLPDGSTETYSDKELYRLEKCIYMAKEPIYMSTLTSLVDYIKGEVDPLYGMTIIQVESPTTVRLFSQLNDQRNREDLVTITARVPEFSFGSFMPQDKFIIALQSKFIDDPESDRELILKFAGTVESGTLAEYGDDGVTQKATIKTGIASKSDAIVPNPVSLRPYRTFLEVEQPKSEFIFRMEQDKYEGIKCGIFEADGGAWKIEATKKIKEYLQFELAEFKYITVIS